jgi:hypothetical protein
MPDSTASSFALIARQRARLWHALAEQSVQPGRLPPIESFPEGLRRSFPAPANAGTPTEGARCRKGLPRFPISLVPSLPSHYLRQHRNCRYYRYVLPVRMQLGGPMAAESRRDSFVVFALAGCLAAGGCAYSGGQSSTFDTAGTPIGMTSVCGPFETLVTPAPPPAGFSSSYQKILVDRQRLARRLGDREAQARALEKNVSDGAKSK